LLRGRESLEGGSARDVDMNQVPGGDLVAGVKVLNVAGGMMEFADFRKTGRPQNGLIQVREIRSLFSQREKF
jgi:hypothetical protein